MEDDKKMKKMRKTLTILLALLLALSLFAGCGGEVNPAGSSQVDDAEDTGDPVEVSEEAKVLRVGMECAYAPYNWMQPTDANGAVPIKDSRDYAYGYDVMMAKYLADKIGYTLEIHMMDWDSLPPAVQSGAIDCAIAGQSITEDRKLTLDFTTPYYYASIVGLVKADSAFAGATGISGLSGASATSQLNTVWYDVCLPQIPGVSILSPMDSAPAMLASLTSGACDLVVTDMPTAMAAVSVYPDLKLLDFTDSPDNFTVSEEEINIGISLQKGNTELLDLLNGALSGLTVADFERMMDEAIRVQPLEVG